MGLRTNRFAAPLNALRGGLIWLSGLVGIGLIFLAWAFHDSGGEQRELAARLAALPDVHAAQEGDTVVVEGEIGETTPLLRDEFAAFVRIQRQAAYRGSVDVVIETARQPLDIVTVTGKVRIENRDYAFDDRPLDWAAEERLETPASATEGAITISGFTHGSPVVAIARVERQSTSIGETVLVHAETIMAGPLDKLVNQLRGSAVKGDAAIPWMLGGALLLLLYAFWEGRRLYRN